LLAFSTPEENASKLGGYTGEENMVRSAALNFNTHRAPISEDFYRNACLSFIMHAWVFR
jgi:hypothetical protein